MKLFAVLPAYEYLENLTNNIKWCLETFPRMFDEFKIVVYNDNIKNVNDPFYTKINKWNNITVYHTTSCEKNLRKCLSICVEECIALNFDLFLVLDSNIIPVKSTFENMFYIYEHSFVNIVSSITPIFKWNNTHCYPTDKKWFKLSTTANVKNYQSIGKVVDVKEYDISLLFSLWNPIALTEILDASLPINHRLDIELCKKVTNKGYHNLRLLDQTVYHIENGLNSISTRLNEINKDDKIKIQPDIVNKNRYKNIEPINVNYKVAVFIQLFYIDTWKSIETYLTNFNFKFDLYINLVEGSCKYKELIQLKREINSTYKDAVIFIVDNRGMDIGNFLYQLNYVKSKNIKYDYALKIHSKKSLHSAEIGFGDKWRKELLDPIIGNTNNIKRVLDNFESNKNIGMIGAKKWLINDKSTRRLALMNNACYIKEYSTKFSLNENNIEFIGGTIFWFRFDDIMNFFNNIDIIKFRNELEFGKFTDHHLPSRTHSMERIFGIMILTRNKTILGI